MRKLLRRRFELHGVVERRRADEPVDSSHQHLLRPLQDTNSVMELLGVCERLALCDRGFDLRQFALRGTVFRPFCMSGVGCLEGVGAFQETPIANLEFDFLRLVVRHELPRLSDGPKRIVVGLVRPRQIACLECGGGRAVLLLRTREEGLRVRVAGQCDALCNRGISQQPAYHRLLAANKLRRHLLRNRRGLPVLTEGGSGADLEQGAQHGHGHARRTGHYLVSAVFCAAATGRSFFFE